MYIGHLNLAPEMNDAEEQLVLLVEALAAHGVRQHALVRSPSLARRLAASHKVTIGPVVRSPVTAYCLMPDVDLLHVHESRGLQTGLLLALTRSIAYVATYRRSRLPGAGPVTRSMYRRAEAIVCTDSNVVSAMQRYAIDTPVVSCGDATAAESSAEHLCPAGMAANYMRIYRQSVDRHSVPAMLL